MRRLVAALVIAVVALSLTGCSSSTPPVPAAVPATPVPVASAPAATPANAALTPTTVSKTNKLSPAEAGVNGAFPTGSRVPTAVIDHVTAHEPMLVYFYDPSQPTSKDQRTEIRAAMDQYRGLIDLVQFDVTAALPDDATNIAKKDKQAEDIAFLTQDLQIGFTPYIILVDKQGVMTGRFRGFVDRGLLKREILRATQ
jgi:hypothetical protein